MNKNQKNVLWCCTIAVVLILLFPPWRFVFSTPPRGPKYSNAGYSFLFLPPPVPVTSRSSDGSIEYFLGEYLSSWNAEINYSRIAIPLAIVLIVGGGLMISHRSGSRG